MTDNNATDSHAGNEAMSSRVVEIAIGLIWADSTSAAGEPNYRLVVGRRPEGVDLAGYDEFPGGKLEPGESPEEAVRRELIEETGLAVRLLGLRLRVDHEYPHGALRLWFFDCEADRSTKDLELNSPFQWLDVAEVFGLRFPEANQPLLESLRRTPGPLAFDRAEPLGPDGQFVDP